METEDKDFEKYLTNVLKQYGYLFPETDSQMAVLEKNLEDVPLPKEFESPNFIFEGKRKIFKPAENSIDNSEGEYNWAIAAREGKEIPDNIREQMKRDKENARKKEGDIE